MRCWTNQLTAWQSANSQGESSSNEEEEGEEDVEQSCETAAADACVRLIRSLSLHPTSRQSHRLVSSLNNSIFNRLEG